MVHCFDNSSISNLLAVLLTLASLSLYPSSAWPTTTFRTKHCQSPECNTSSHAYSFGGKQRVPWEEIDLEPHESSISSDHSIFLQGESVILFPSIIDATECEVIVEAAQKAAEEHRRPRLSNGFATNNDDKGSVRLPTIMAARRAARSNTPCAKPLDSFTDSMLSGILKRVFQVVDQEFPCLVVSLFQIDADDDSSLEELWNASNDDDDDGFVFASREPAINVYSAGGQFHAHTDGQKLTVLIPLNDDFCGGGTAFWSESRRHRVDPPSLVVKPRMGTAIVFSGHVMHSGLPVETGSRVVLVASFSPRRGG